MKPKVHARNRLHALVRFLLACGIMALAVLPAAYAQSPTHSLQGRLTDSNGGPLPDGTYTFEVRYMSCSEGTLLWSEMHDVEMTGNGVFNLHLGYETPIDPSMFFEDVGLSLTIDGDVVLPELCTVDAVPSASVSYRLGPDALKAGDGTTIERQDDGALMISATGGGTGGLASVASDGTLMGDGTAGSVLGIAPGSIRGDHLADGAIVGDGNIIVSRQNDGSFVMSASDLFSVSFEANSLTGDGTPENPLDLANGGVTSEKLADGSVTGLKIAVGAIVGGENIIVSRQNDGSVMIEGTSEGFTMVHIEAFGLTGNGTPENPLGLANGGVSSEKLAEESVTSAKVAEGSVTASKLDDRVIKAGDGIQVTRTSAGSFEIALKRGAAFRVNPSLDAENLPLLPSVVASPEPTAVYNGNVVLDARGEAVVVLPESFAALSDEVRYQLTCIGGFAPVYVAEEITANRFSIAGGTPGMKVSWQVTGVR